jgi:hydrogenase maturation protein HypF
VLLQKSVDGDAVLTGIAPGLSKLGLMLPYTPLHYLMFHEMLGRPQGTDWLQRATPLAWVMTSANPGGSPLVIDDDEARQSLGGLADAFLTHDRGILQRCDDSVMKWQGAAPAFIRRARGYTPRRIQLPFAGPSILACGAWLKNTVCITRGNEAFVSQHIGDLDQSATRAMLEETVQHLCGILDVQPQAVAHDLHPDFYSTEFAQRYAVQHNLPIFAVQHHHAHIAAICAEHGVSEPVLGLALDGVGLGSDGQAWGGELLCVANENAQRMGHLAPLLMPGGDKAAREPWRMAAAVLHSSGRAHEIATRFPEQPGAATISAMLQRGVNCPATSSMGRLFDAAAGLLGVSASQSYEGQAAMLLEGMADRYGNIAPLLRGFEISAAGVLDFSPLLVTLSDCDDDAYGAAVFHATLAEGLAVWVERTAVKNDLGSVVLGGGCFLNNVLSQALTQRLSARGLRVLTARQLPPNDGGISLGQAWIALHQLVKGN